MKQIKTPERGEAIDPLRHEPQAVAFPPRENSIQMVSQRRRVMKNGPLVSLCNRRR
jgi:hypothetical protein